MLQQIIAYIQVFFVIVTSLFVRLGFLPNGLTVQPTVFVAENEYQIVWESSQPSAAWVVVGGETYSDSLGGNLYWDQTVHKVCVPMDKLDAARGYEIHWQHVMRAHWEIRMGSDNAKTYDFRPVDFSDGLQIYHLSDSHSNLHPAAETGTYWGDKLDLLILNGDIINDIQAPAARTDAMKLAWEITRGERPVLYARGNHETRGSLANDLSRYVGTPGGDRWYFTTRLGPLWIAVYDVGEDKLDDHQEYYGLADFAQYREKEAAFFDRVIANAAAEFDAPGVEYRLLVSHVPIGDASRPFPEMMARWLDQANQMKLDLALSGHWHRTQYYPAGEYNPLGTAAAYPLIIGSSPAHANALGVYTAAAVEFQPATIQAWFTDQRHAIAETLPEISR